ncbi:MAG TPA: alpha/beta fold hydrolase [Micromonosporaceae bacterium]
MDTPTLVLLHGAGSTHDAWAPQIGPLSDHFDVIAPDLPGYGSSPGPFTLDRAVDSLAELVRGRVHLCGLSAGAVVALRFAAVHPDAVESLILSGVQVRPPRLAMAAQNLVMTLLPASRLSTPDGGVTKAGMLTALRELGKVDLYPDLPKVKARTLVVCGSRDRVNLPAARKAASGIAGAELRVIPGAGHLWNGEQPDLFNRMVLEWALGSVNPAAD